MIINFIISLPAVLLCRLNISPRKKIRICIKVVTDIYGQSQVTNAAIQNSIAVMKVAYERCNIDVEVTGIERIVNPSVLTTTDCFPPWGLFSLWHAWFAQNACSCCGRITVYFVDVIQGASGCTYWGENHCRVDASANNDPSVMAHEVGHVLNLGHSNDPNNIMYKSFSPTTRNLTIRQCCIMRTSPYASYI